MVLAPSRPPFGGTAARVVRGTAFWVAVALPFLAVALLALGGDPSRVGALLAGNAVALVVGHDYGNRDH